jgi:hypothetical protein
MLSTHENHHLVVDVPAEALDGVDLELVEVGLQEPLRRQILGTDGVEVNEHERVNADSSELQRHLSSDGAGAHHVGDGVN